MAFNTTQECTFSLFFKLSKKQSAVLVQVMLQVWLLGPQVKASMVCIVIKVINIQFTRM